MTYQPFPISDYRTGFSEAVEPWLNPRDAFQQMINAHLYRGIVEKIDGYILFATMSNRNILVLTGSGKTWTGTLTSAPITTNFFGYGTIVAGSSAETFSYNGDASSTVINLSGNAGGTGTLNLTTLLVTLNFNSVVPDNDVFFIWDSAVSGGPYAIMGIKQYYESNGGQQVMVFDQRRVGLIVPNMGVIGSIAGADNGISEIPHAYYQTQVIVGDGATTSFSGTLTGHPLVPGTVTFFQFMSSGSEDEIPVNGLPVGQNITDNGQGGLIGPTPGYLVSGSINYVTGDWAIVFTTAPASGNYFDATTGVYGDLFTGGISNFFSLVNYQYKAFFTNDIDPIFYYDGNLIQYLNTNLENKVTTAGSGVPNNYDITTCLHVFVTRNRLLLMSPVVEGTPQTSAVYWSELGNPLNFTNDEQEYADTSEPIRTFGVINTDVIIRFANSERILTYTDDNIAPFRFDATNNIWACDGPYSAINYDKWFSSVGRPAIVGSDGVNVQRVDEIIPDFTDPDRIPQLLPVPFMSQTSIAQCYGQRFDDLKEGWLCYNSNPVDESVNVASDNVLSFNYIDKTYTIYQFPFSCLGLGRIINVPTWGTTYTLWEDAAEAWGSFSTQNNSLIDLGGDQYDRVYQLNEGNTQTNVAGDTIPMVMSVITKNFNPFIDEGQLCRFGYLDLFVSANSDTTLRVQFYLNDQLYVDGSGNPAGFYQETVLTFDTEDAMSPTTNQTKVWKRIYVGAVAKTHTIRFYQQLADLAETDDQPVYIHAMVLYMKPAGRIFN